MPSDSPSSFPYEKGCYVLLAGILFILFASWLKDCFEILSGLMMGIFFLWQVIRGLIIKRHFWHIPDEKVSFYSLLIALILATTFYFICHGPVEG